MPAPSPRTRLQLKFYARQRITQAHNGQNDANRVLAALDAVIDATYNAADDGNPNGGGASAGSFAALTSAARDNLNLKTELDRGPNLRPSGYAAVTVLSPASQGYAPGMATRAELDPATLFIGAVCRAEFSDATDGTRNLGSTARLAYDTGSSLLVYQDGRLSGPRTFPASWVELDSADEARANVRAWSADITDWVLGEVLLYTLGGTEGFYQTKFAGGPKPAPTGPDDVNYHQVGPPVPANAPTATLSEAVFVLLAGDNALGTYVNKDLYITDLASGDGNVVVRVFGNKTFEPNGLQFDPANPDAPALPVSVSIDNDQVVTSPRSSGGGNADAILAPISPVTSYPTVEIRPEGPFDFKQILRVSGPEANDAYFEIQPGNEDPQNGGSYNKSVLLNNGYTTLALVNDQNNGERRGELRDGKWLLTGAEADVKTFTDANPQALIRKDYLDAYVAAAIAAALGTGSPTPGSGATGDTSNAFTFTPASGTAADYGVELLP